MKTAHLAAMAEPPLMMKPTLPVPLSPALMERLSIRLSPLAGKSRVISRKRASTRKGIKGRASRCANFTLSGLALTLLLVPTFAAANCTSAFCTLNTDWNAQTPWLNNATSLDLRMETIHQNQVRSGVNKSVATGHDREVETINRNGWFGLSHAFTRDLNVSVQIPLVSRDHLHIHLHDGVLLPERWDFTRLGDVRVLAHVRLDDKPSSVDGMYGMMAGIKLPTGSTDERNRDGVKAEPTLQPGTGSTDLIAGGFVSGRLTRVDWHMQLRWQHAVSVRQQYRPGDQVGLDAGIRYPLGPVHALAQINLLWRDRDTGMNAESDDSGGKFIYFSPGVALPLGKDMQVYGLVQLPLYQYVQGTQLTADWAATLGLSMRF